MESLAAQIRQNILSVTERIHSAAQVSRRDEGSVRLVVVTKSQPVDVIRAAVEVGAKILGENYPEETLPKMQALSGTGEIEWHMIGHLQSRKAGLVTANFQMLESLDSLKLAEKLSRILKESAAQASGSALPVLLEMNVSGEENKHGWPAWEKGKVDLCMPEVEQILALPYLTLRGLMTMPPLADYPEQNLKYFARLRELARLLGERFGEQYFHELSMGTSGDFEAAVQEGATLVRIGTAILGPRKPKVDA